MDTWVPIEKWSWGLVRWLGAKIANVFIWLGITANQLTIYRFVIGAPLVFLGFSYPTYWGALLGLLFLLIYGVLDFADGTIAVKTNSTSLVGGWLDGRYDFTMQCVVLAGCTMHIVLAGQASCWVGVGIAALFSQAVLVHYTDMFGGLFNSRPEFFRNMDEAENLAVWERVVIDIVVTRSSASVVVFSYRYWVFILTLLGRLEWMLLGLAITQNIRWIVLHIVMARLLISQERSPGIWGKMWGYVDAEYTVPNL